MCDDGRFGFRYVHSADRLTTLRIGREEEVASTNSVASGQVHGNSEAPDLVSIDRWPAAISLAQQRLHDAARQRPEGVWGIFSPFMTCEEAYLLADSLKRLSPTIQLALGPVPIDGVDDAYPKGIGGKPPTPGNTKFVIHAEKCPNRRGVEVVLRHFQGKVIPWQDAHAACQSHAVDLLYAVGGYPDPWISEEQASVLAQAKFLIVQDILASPLSRHADLLLPSASFAEREGTYVNYKGLTQQIRPAIRPPGDARPDSRWLMELAGRPGLYHGPDMRAEMSAKIPYFVGIDVGGQLPAAKQEAERMTVTVIDVPKERK
jgi:NADH-quinone oxidoreductase subunit G